MFESYINTGYIWNNVFNTVPFILNPNPNPKIISANYIDRTCRWTILFCLNRLFNLSNCQYILFKLTFIYFVKTDILFKLPLYSNWTITFFGSNSQIVLFQLPFHFVWTVIYFLWTNILVRTVIFIQPLQYFALKVVTFCFVCQFILLL